MSRSRIRVLSLFGCVVASLIVTSGCSTGTSQTIDFDRFVMQIDSNMVSIPARSVENKRITDRVIAAYQLPTNDGSYRNNLIIATLPYNRLNTPEDFVDVIIQGLRTAYPGYTSDQLRSRSITCGDATSTIYLHTYQVNRAVGTTSPTVYYIVQQHIFLPGRVLVLSMSSDNPDDVSGFQSQMRSVACRTTQ